MSGHKPDKTNLQPVIHLKVQLNLGSFDPDYWARQLHHLKSLPVVTKIEIQP